MIAQSAFRCSDFVFSSSPSDIDLLGGGRDFLSSVSTMEVVNGLGDIRLHCIFLSTDLYPD